MATDPSSDTSASTDDPQKQIAELSTLYEFARALLGATDARQVAWRSVYSGLGALGVRSGAMFVADERGRFRRLCAAGLPGTPHGETLSIPAAAREWILERPTFPLASSAAARALGELRNKLIHEYDAVVAAAVPGERGLLALMVFGPPLLPGVTTPDSPILLETLAALTGQALDVHAPPRATDTDPTLEAAAKPAGDTADTPSRPRAARSTSLTRLRHAHPVLETLVGESPALADACQDLVAVAPTRFPVLLTGESGVGKELAATAVHRMSDRVDGPFEVIDCGSIPAELIESELFGHVRGAFTGAQRDRRGAFELAHRGTLFLDEIGEMPLQLQTRLLRVLQEGRFRRVGDERLIDVDVRVVAATNRDLRKEVAEKRFRQDLYYRLNVFAVHMPALRERPDDIGILLEHFLTIQGRELGVRKWRLDPEVVHALQVYGWPGNIRELVNLCAALVVHSRDSGNVSLSDLAHVWKRQRSGQSAPWAEGDLPAREHVGQWVVDQARATRFNLVELARLLQRQKRAGQNVPVAERSALSYYLTGEILRALAGHDGDPDATAAELAGDEELAPKVRTRVMKVIETLEAVAGDPKATQRKFGKLPAGYEDALAAAIGVVGAAT